MIAQLKGKIISRKPTRLVIEVNGLGFEINITTNTFETLGDSTDVLLYTYLSVKEDSLTLYGFATPAEKEMFKLLISISGIGPKLAQGILSGIQIGELRLALQEGNISRITAIPGVGKKTAERLMVELRDKVHSIESMPEDNLREFSSTRADAIAALISLGYNQKKAEGAIRKVLAQKPDVTIEELIRLALAQVNQ